MSDMRFTPEQYSAIMADPQELLVSAAAGSGKTAVLVERILRLIREKHISIDRMLVVTYTRAAAGELRERLELRLSEAARSEPELSQQLEKLGMAQISTIHSYCQRVIKEHFRHCGVDPQFTLCDERTKNNLYQESLNQTLDSAYAAAAEHADLHALLSVLPEKELVPVVDLLYRFLMTRPDPMGWMRSQSALVWSREMLEEHPLCQMLLNESELILASAYSAWEQAEKLTHNPAFPEGYLKTIAADLDTLGLVQDSIRKGLGALCSTVGQTKFVTLARVKPDSTEAAELTSLFRDLRDEYKAAVTEIKKLLPDDLDAALSDMNRMIPALRGLEWIMEALLSTFRSVKQEHGVLDFDDLEHMTLEVLAEPELSRLESSRFDAVFVDEYQDVSAIQEAILNGLKRQDGTQSFFYVGDVKQSIYRFRQAEPTLFLNKLDTFSQEEDAPQRKIVLNRNFRSRETVLSSVNRVFRHVMDRRVTEIDYDRSAMLYPGRPSMEDPATELHVLPSDAYDKRHRITAQAEWIARDILRTVGQSVISTDGSRSEPLHYRDIVILMPVVKNLADKVEAVLVKAGIPVYVDAAMNAMGSEEVTQVAQHLMLLDNLKNDLALIAELRSPLFDMSEQELTEIRLRKPEREASFLDALTFCAETEQSALGARCRQALEMLHHERFLYRSMPVEEYLWDFLMRSGLYAHYGCQPGGKLRQANLRMLCHRAGEYAQAHAEGMQGFLSTLRDGGDSTSPTVVNPWEDVVRIMTIHKSKGLEFPTVYLMGLEDAITKRRTTKTLSMHPQLGLGLMYRNHKARTKRTTLLQACIDLRSAVEMRAEKARVLYVAMTRPKNRLVMVGMSSSGLEEVRSKAALRGSGAGSIAKVRTAKTLMDWLLQTIDEEEITSEKNDKFVSDSLLSKSENQGSESTVPTCFPQKTGDWQVVFHSEDEESRGSQEMKNVNTDLDEKLLPFDYILPVSDSAEDPLSPLRTMPSLPLKVGVTALCRAIREQSPVEPEEETAEQKRYPLLSRQPRLLSSLPDKPQFLAPREEDQAILRGVCTHRLLSAILIEEARQASQQNRIPAYLEEEIRRLQEQGVMTAEEAQAADRRMVARYLMSDEGQRMLRAETIRREWPFNLRVTEPFPTMVQGVIDLCYLEEGAWVLLDFKTDWVEQLDDLWDRYGMQLAFYCRALEAGTPYPVKEYGLYSLRLGQKTTRIRQKDEKKINL